MSPSSLKVIFTSTFQDPGGTVKGKIVQNILQYSVFEEEFMMNIDTL